MHETCDCARLDIRGRRDRRNASFDGSYRVGPVGGHFDGAHPARTGHYHIGEGAANVDGDLHARSASSWSGDLHNDGAAVLLVRCSAGDVSVLEIGFDRRGKPIGGRAVPSTPRSAEPDDVAWPEVYIGCAGRCDRRIVDGDPTAASRRATGNAFGGIARPPGRTG